VVLYWEGRHCTLSDLERAEPGSCELGISHKRTTVRATDCEHIITTTLVQYCKMA